MHLGSLLPPALTPLTSPRLCSLRYSEALKPWCVFPSLFIASPLPCSCPNFLAFSTGPEEIPPCCQFSGVGARLQRFFLQVTEDKTERIWFSSLTILLKSLGCYVLAPGNAYILLTGSCTWLRYFSFTLRHSFTSDTLKNVCDNSQGLSVFLKHCHGSRVSPRWQVHSSFPLAQGPLRSGSFYSRVDLNIPLRQVLYLNYPFILGSLGSNGGLVCPGFLLAPTDYGGVLLSVTVQAWLVFEGGWQRLVSVWWENLPQNMPTVTFGLPFYLVFAVPTWSRLSFSFIIDALKIHFTEVSGIFLGFLLILFKFASVKICI